MKNRARFILVFLILLTAINAVFHDIPPSGSDSSPYKSTNSHLTAGNKIIFIGDTQHKSFLEYFLFYENNVKETRQLFNEIAKREPSFVVHLGDITGFGSSENQWGNFVEDSKPVQEKKILFYPVFGNHDYFGDNEECYRNFYDHFPHIKDKKWYSFSTYKTGFIMLNSNFDNLTDEETETQKKWYLNVLDSLENDAETNFIIVCSHHPPYTNSKVVSPSEEIRNNYALPFRKCKKTALFFSGHCHSYERFIEGGKYFIVSGGGGGSRQKLDPDGEFDDRYNGPEIRFFHFCEIEINDENINFKVVRLNCDGSFSEIDTLTIPKAD